MFEKEIEFWSMSPTMPNITCPFIGMKYLLHCMLCWYFLLRHQMLTLSMGNQGPFSLLLRNVIISNICSIVLIVICIILHIWHLCSTDAFAMVVESGKIYLLRIVNAALNDELFFAIGGTI